jgi:hypothetical protein
MFDSLLENLESELQGALQRAVTGLVATARTRLEDALAEVAKERAKGLAEMAEERAKGLAEVNAIRGELSREVEAMHKHTEAQEGRVELNIGGYRFETSVQTLRRVPHTFFDAYFSGRYAQDVCADGSIFVDRDGEHFGHILEYMRNGVVAVAEASAYPSVSLLRALKREFGFYCIELNAEEPEEPELPEIVYVMGGDRAGGVLSSMERYDSSSGKWSPVSAMGTPRQSFGACVVAGVIYIIGGRGAGNDRLSSVEKYTPSSDTWSIVAPLPAARSSFTAIAVGPDIYVMGGVSGAASASVLKYNSVQDSWTEVAPMPERRFASVACPIGTNIYVLGGIDHVARAQASVFEYDTEANTWSTLAPMPVAIEYLASASVIDGLIYIVGAGDHGHAVLRFDPASGAWGSIAPTLHNRGYGKAFVLGGCMYAAGGSPSGSSTERYDIVTNTWIAQAGMLEGRSHFEAVTIGSVGPAEEEDLFDSLIVKASEQRLSTPS